MPFQRYSYGAPRPHCFDDDFTSRKRPHRGEQYAGAENRGTGFAVDSNFASSSRSKRAAENCHPSLDHPKSCVQTSLSSASYSEFDLIHHLHRVSEENTATVVALGDVFRQRDELTIPTVFKLEVDVPDSRHGLPACEVYEVGPNAVVVPWNPRRSYTNDDDTEAAAVWNLVKDTNISGTAVGRITILHQPSPTTVASIHLTMGQHFHMDELLSRIVSNGVNNGKAASYVQKTSERKLFHQNAVVFVFKYYTIIGKDANPPVWQRYSRSTSNSATTDHIDFSECTSIIAITSENQSIGHDQTHGATHEPFHVLNIRCFPDNIRSERRLDEEPCCSGPHAFLRCLAMEFKNATVRFGKLNEQVAHLVLPSSDFIFDVNLRDKLLFEDEDYTHTRRYFWAFTFLALVNESIRSMIHAYDETFSDKFWLGKDPSLWPHTNPESEDGQSYLAQLGCVRRELEESIDDLRSLTKSNNELRQQIESLREQLYSGSSVKENRMAIEQGENIKILTGVSMLFLPLSFVMSVFGMELISIPPNDWRFIVTMITVCVPFFILIFILQTHAGMSLFRRLRRAATRYFERRQQRAVARQEQRSQLQQTEMIRRRSSQVRVAADDFARRQSCATTVVAANRQTSWKFDPAAVGDARVVGVGNAVDVEEAGWWGRWGGRKLGAEESVGSTNRLNV